MAKEASRSVCVRVRVCACVFECVCVPAELLLTFYSPDFYLSGQNRKRCLFFAIAASPSVKPSILLSFSLIHILYHTDHYRTEKIAGFIPTPQNSYALSGLQISCDEEILFVDKVLALVKRLTGFANSLGETGWLGF